MKTHYDLIIIGGGILGITVARDAAKAGKSVLLLEKGRFSQGASSKTSKLAHGGLRYLEQGALSLVRESVHERDALVKYAPHAVKPLPFIIPVYKNSRRPFWQIKIGLWIYSFFSRNGEMPAHKILSKSEIKTYAPNLNIDKLSGAALYYDAQMDDEGLVLDVMAQALSYGAICKAFHTLTKIDPASKNKTEKVTLHGTHLTGTFTYTADKVLLATGAWGNVLMTAALGKNENIVRPSKGSHIVIKQVLSSAAITLTSPIDGRVFFVIPYKDHTLVGTTESDFTGSPDAVSITEAEKDYLTRSVNHFFPLTPVQKSDILWSFSGLRPLAATGEGKNATQASRELAIKNHSPNIWSVSGGKYTTFQAISKEILITIYTHKHISLDHTHTAISPANFSLRQSILAHSIFLKIAHRGSAEENGVVENSMPAFRHALANEASMIECDLQFTADREIVIFHDDTGERLCNSSARITESTAEQIKSMTFTDAPNEHPPFLSELLDLLKNRRTYLYLELKTKDGDETAMALFEKSLEMVKENGLEDKVWFAAFDSQLLCDIHKKYPDVLLAWNVKSKDVFENYNAQIKGFTPIICPSKEMFNDDEFNALISDGWKVVPYTIKTKEDVERFREIAVSGLTSDSVFLLN